LAEVVKLRDHVLRSQATAGELLADTPEERRAKLNAIAVKVGVHILPLSFEKWIHKIVEFIGIPLELVGEAHGIPFVGVAWAIVQAPLGKSAASSLQKLRYVQRRVEFPGVESAWQRPSLDAVRRKLRRQS